MSERRRPLSLSEEFRALQQATARQTQELTALRQEVAALRQENASLRQTLVNLASTVAARITQALTPVTELQAALAAPQQSAQELSGELFELRRLLMQLAPRTGAGYGAVGAELDRSESAGVDRGGWWAWAWGR